LVEAGVVLDGTYKILRRIGEGGMGQVYEARHARLSGRYAVKVLNSAVSAQPEAVARFRREAQVTSALHHPGIVQIIDFNTTAAGISYLVMEYLEGSNLERIIDQQGPLVVDRAVEITRQVAAALTAAHRKGIVHRDLKPQNIFLVAHDRADEEPERAKVLDFGISKIRSASRPLTETSVVMGTPQYMSPEQAEGKTSDVDAQTDQFALAAIVYEMLTGAPAFTGDTLASVVYKVVHQDPESITLRRPELPRDIQNVVARGLSKRKADRFASAADFAAALKTASLAPAPRRRAGTAAPLLPPPVVKAAGAVPTPLVSVDPLGGPRPSQGTLMGMSRSAAARTAPPSGYPANVVGARKTLKATTSGRHTGELLRLMTRATENRARVAVSAAVLTVVLALVAVGVRSKARSTKPTTTVATAGGVPTTSTARSAAIQPIASPSGPPPPAAEFDIASDPPGIALWVDGQPFPNPTKQMQTRAHGSLSAGPHTFELARLGFQTWHRTVEMTPNAPTRLLARLKRDDGPGGPTTVWPPPVPAAARAAPAVAPPSPAAGPAATARCSLTVGSTPWAQVWIDGDNTLRNTPAVGLKLPCGSHRLDLRRADLKIDFITNVTLTPGKEVKAKYQLEGAPGAASPPR
jgi:serine/threonine protein kinase